MFKIFNNNINNNNTVRGNRSKILFQLSDEYVFDSNTFNEIIKPFINGDFELLNDSKNGKIICLSDWGNKNV